MNSLMDTLVSGTEPICECRRYLADFRWFIRAMQRLQDADEDKFLEFTEWESESKILPLN
jgi:hypothetical protein